MADEIGSVYVSILPSFKGGQAAIQKEFGGQGNTAGTAMGGGMVAAAKKFVAPLAAIFAVGAVARFGEEAINQASSLNESVNALNVTYGESSREIQQLGKEAATSLGLSNLEFNQLAVRFSAFSKTIAGDGGNVVSVLDDLTTRASDFASVMDLEVAEAAQLFQSGLAGETEPLRRFGIDMSAAAVEAYALSNGLAASKSEMTEAIKVQARYGLLMQQTEATAGDFANTSGELANQQRQLNSRWADLQAQLGTALLPVATKVVELFNQAIPVISEIASQVQSGEGEWGELATTFRQDVLPQMKELWAAFKTDVLPVLKEVGKWLVSDGIPMWIAYQRGVFKAIGIVVDVIKFFYTTAKTQFDLVKNAVTGTINFFRDMPRSIASAVSGVYNAIVAPFKRAFNTVAAYWNRTLGQVSFSAPDWLAYVGGGAIAGKSFGIPKIPMLADGGNIVAPGLALVGEAGPELLNLPRGASVTPLENGSGNVTMENHFYGITDAVQAAQEIARRQYGMAV